MCGGNIRYFKDLLKYNPAKELEREDGVSYPQKGQEVIQSGGRVPELDEVLRLLLPHRGTLGRDRNDGR
jgi:hypothetical protein